ncbi:MAG: hypothetical protein IT210_18190 [Armatimonadetes bacterium]|nr:hypothetical protein [Armatimonadota bacterium]
MTLEMASSLSLLADGIDKIIAFILPLSVLIRVRTHIPPKSSIAGIIASAAENSFEIIVRFQRSLRESPERPGGQDSFRKGMIIRDAL